MEKDPELTAMTSVAQALEGLDERTTARVLKWAFDRFGVSTKFLGAGKGSGGTEKFPLAQDDNEVEKFKDLPTLYDAANPTTASEKALVVGYWFQEIEGNENFESQALNTKLKNMGHGVKNITRAFDVLQNMTPRLVIQIQKSGQTKQARKKYKVTTEGIRKVQEMMQVTKGRGEK
ncbi:MAG: hypothetical protein HYZ90_00470 [Candidatus Omnitrophica bacterium]|nr:hypothetical protein [Candidatus Omnitrophota bacterium]